MNYLDYIIIGIIVAGFIFGYKDGLIRKIIGLGGIFLGIFLAVKLSGKFGRFISPLLDHEEYLAEIVAGVIIFILVISATSILKRLINPHDKVIGFANQVLGGLTGILQILFLSSGFFLFLHIFQVPKPETVARSFLYTPVFRVMPETIDFMIGGTDFVKEYIENKDKSRTVITDSEKKTDTSARTESKAVKAKRKKIKNPQVSNE
ncbi:MAG: CvpA family protein [Ignavibacteria bacterium]